MLSLVTAVIKPHALEAVKDALKAAGVAGLTVTEVKGFGRQGGHSETYRGTEYQVDFVPKVKLEVVVPSDQAESVSRVIVDSAASGKIGDGKVWFGPLDGLTRIRTGEMGLDAI